MEESDDDPFAISSSQETLLRDAPFVGQICPPTPTAADPSDAVVTLSAPETHGAHQDDFNTPTAVIDVDESDDEAEELITPLSSSALGFSEPHMPEEIDLGVSEENDGAETHSSSPTSADLSDAILMLSAPETQGGSQDAFHTPPEAPSPPSHDDQQLPPAAVDTGVYQCVLNRAVIDVDEIDDEAAELLEPLSSSAQGFLGPHTPEENDGAETHPRSPTSADLSDAIVMLSAPETQGGSQGAFHTRPEAPSTPSHNDQQLPPVDTGVYQCVLNRAVIDVAESEDGAVVESSHAAECRLDDLEVAEREAKRMKLSEENERAETPCNLGEDPQPPKNVVETRFILVDGDGGCGREASRNKETRFILVEPITDHGEAQFAEPVRRVLPTSLRGCSVNHAKGIRSG